MVIIVMVIMMMIMIMILAAAAAADECITDCHDNSIVHIRYTFGCRQPAVDDKNKVIAFNLFPNARNVLSIGAQTTVAVVRKSFR